MSFIAFCEVILPDIDTFFCHDVVACITLGGNAPSHVGIHGLVFFPSLLLLFTPISCRVRQYRGAVLPCIFTPRIFSSGLLEFETRAIYGLLGVIWHSAQAIGS
jgi:hypothetical protein